MFDANGDGYDDLTCHSSNGTITISESHIVDQRQRNAGANTENRDAQDKTDTTGTEHNNTDVDTPTGNGKWLLHKCKILKTQSLATVIYT